MLAPLVQIAWRGRRIHGAVPDHVLSVYPEPGWERGRKGARMAGLWKELRSGAIPGVVWMDPDIAADPHDCYNMDLAVKNDPHSVHVSCHKLWPGSTGRDEWVWGFGRWTDNGPEMSQVIAAAPGWFALGMTYTPRRLLNAALPQLPHWHYGQNDMGLSAIARKLDITIDSVYGCQPRHLHLDPGEDYLEWVSVRSTP